MKIIVRNAPMQNGYQALVDGKPALWAAGKTANDAIGDLIRTHPEAFGIQIEYPAEVRCVA